MLRRPTAVHRLPRPVSRIAPTGLTLTHGLMVISGLLTFLAVSSVLEDRSATVDVLVARESIEDGAPVRVDDLTAVPIAVGHPLLDQLTPILAFDEGLARRPIAAGEPVLRSDVLAVGAEAGGRTFTVPVDDRVIDGLALRPGDRVDVVGVNGNGQVDVVASDLEVTRLPDTGTAGGLTGSLGGSFVTVEVTPAQVINLIAALRVEQVEIVRSTGAPSLAPPLPTVAVQGQEENS